jgi:hypothetical protein
MDHEEFFLDDFMIFHHNDYGSYWEIKDKKKYVEHFERVGWAHCRTEFLNTFELRDYYDELREEGLGGIFRDGLGKECIICLEKYNMDDQMLNCCACNDVIISICENCTKGLTNLEWNYVCPFCLPMEMTEENKIEFFSKLERFGFMAWNFKCESCDQYSYLFNRKKKKCFDCFSKTE